MIRQLVFICVGIVLVVGRPDASSRILGGQVVAHGDIPYQASLQYWNTTFHFAGGVLLNTRWVLSTAKGVFGRAGNSINVILGTNRLDIPFGNRQSDQIRTHPLYDQSIHANDVAVIRTAAVIAFSVIISPMTLATHFINDGVTAQVSGWGAVNEDKTGESVVLRRVAVTTGPCVNTEFMTFNSANHFCAGAPTNDTRPLVGICTRDVGGPLVLDNLLIGIPFHHDPRACGQFLDGYMRISSYRAWILGNIPV